MTHIFHKPSWIRLAVLAGGMACAGLLPAQTPAWFPLEVGNTWLYRPTGPNNRPGSLDYKTISVHGSESIAGRDYFDVSYFGRELLLRVEPSNGSVIVYERASGSEQIFLALGLPVGGTFPTQINPCPTSGQIAARDASVTTLAGEFTNAVQVKFQGNCVDVGVTQQYYAPYVGLVRDEETAFNGPLQFDLVYYRVGTTSSSAPEVSFTVATDAPRYAAGGFLEARLTLRSTSPDPILLHFPSGQSFDFRIKNVQGDVGYLWSTARSFPMIVRDETFGPGEHTYGLTVPLGDLPPGHYIAEGYLTTNPLMYLGQTSFDIVAAQNPAASRNLRRGVVKEASSRVSLK